MKEHIEAIRKLFPDSLTCYYVDVPEKPTYPYVLLWSTAGQPGDEPALSANGDLTDLLGATTVDTTPANALHTTEIVRGILDGSTPDVDGRSVRLKFAYSEQVQVDRTITMQDTNRHPAFCVDRYRLDSTPA